MCAAVIFSIVASASVRAEPQSLVDIMVTLEHEAADLDRMRQGFCPTLPGQIRCNLDFINAHLAVMHLTTACGELLIAVYSGSEADLKIAEDEVAIAREGVNKHMSVLLQRYGDFSVPKR